MQARKKRAPVGTLPEMAVPTAERAISLVNGWLHDEISTAVNVSQAHFNAVTYCWHLPVQLAFPDTGPVAVIADIYLHAATGQFVGLVEAGELQRRAESLAVALGLLDVGSRYVQALDPLADSLPVKFSPATFERAWIDTGRQALIIRIRAPFPPALL